MVMNKVNMKKQLPPKEDRHKLFGSVEPGPKLNHKKKAKCLIYKIQKKIFYLN